MSVTSAARKNAHAQNPPPSIELQWYRPAMGGGMLETNVGEVTRHLTMTGGVYSSASRRLLRTELDDEEVPLGDVVNQRVDAWGSVGVGLFDVAELRVLVPYVAYQDGLNTEIVRLAAGRESASGGFLGDISADLRIAALQQEDFLPAIAVRVAGYFPTGDPERFGGQEDGAFEGTVIVSKTLGLHVLALEAGYLYRPETMRVINLEIGDEVLFRAGYRGRFGRRARPLPVSVVAEVSGRTSTDRPFGASGGDFSSDVSMEGRVGLRYRSSSSAGLFDVDVASGFALSSGYGGAQPRIVVGVSYATSDPVADDDYDGFVNAYDQCENEPEDYDDFQDQDGCPDLDNDGDEIPDEDDECPNTPETLNDLDDLDGCPDRIIPDTDGDGLNDEEDRCTYEPEDFDRFEDEDGCPELDNDGDGLSDLSDLCPNEPEDMDGDADDDGCIDEAKVTKRARKSMVAMLSERLDFRQPVTFEKKSATLTQSGVELLEEAAALLNKRVKPAIVIKVFPTRRSRKARRLAKERAERIKSELEIFGVGASRMTAEAGKWKRARRGDVVVNFARGAK